MGKRQGESMRTREKEAKKPAPRTRAPRSAPAGKAAKELTPTAPRPIAPAPIQLASARRLVDWFDRNQRVLPWRESPTLYRVWISEIMLQQTQVATVLPYFERFMAAFPTVERLAAADADAVLKNWAGLGYYSRARNVHRAAKEIVARAREESATADAGFPRNREGWLEIPGVGPYTAGAITSIALGLPEPIVDGNVERVFARMRRLARADGEAVYKESLWALSRAVVVAAHAAGLPPSSLNQAWMELGATVCVPRNPACGICPVAADCLAHAAGEVERYPEKKKRAEWVELSERRVALVDLRRGLVYVVQAGAGEWRAGLWDFPAELPAAMARGLGKSASLGTIETRHVVTKHKITRALAVASVSAEARPFREGPGRWVKMSDPEVGLGSASRRGIRAILERFGA